MKKNWIYLDLSTIEMRKLRFLKIFSENNELTE